MGMGVRGKGKRGTLCKGFPSSPSPRPPEASHSRPFWGIRVDIYDFVPKRGKLLLNCLIIWSVAYSGTLWMYPSARARPLFTFTT